MQRQHRQVFVLTLSSEQSIGPHELRAMWALACDSLDISVRRRPLSTSNHRRFSYDLCASAESERPLRESRLRALLQAKGLNYKLIYFPDH